MLIHTILPRSRSNGPGIRCTIWVQGCSRRCPDCFNRRTWKPESAHRNLSVTDISAYIPQIDIDGITISGGEPFEQPGELAQLLSAAHEMSLHTLVYSGYTYAELAAMPQAQEALHHTDMLIDGPFIKNIPPRNQWTGSGNQRVYCLKNGSIERDITDIDTTVSTSEILIAEDGHISITGTGSATQVSAALVSEAQVCEAQVCATALALADAWG